jgi:hypothetical protein
LRAGLTIARNREWRGRGRGPDRGKHLQDRLRALPTTTATLKQAQDILLAHSTHRPDRPGSCRAWACRSRRADAAPASHRATEPARAGAGFGGPPFDARASVGGPPFDARDPSR